MAEVPGVIWAAVIAAVSGVAGAFLAYLSGRYAARQAAKASVETRRIEAEVAARRDTIADRDALIDRLQARNSELEEQESECEAQRDDLRERLEDARRREYAKDMHIRRLRAQITRRRPPPPVDPPIPY